MLDEQSLLILLASSLLLLVHRRKKRRRRKLPTYRVSPYLLGRNSKGRYKTDFNDLMKNPILFQENFHMTLGQFNNLYDRIKPYLLPKRYVRPHDYISSKQKLAIVLEYFASGDLQRHIASCYRLSKQHLGTIIDDVSDAVCTVLKHDMPDLSKEFFLDVANDYNARWFFPNCIGAIDGKHVAIKAPHNSGSLFYNYKGFFSIVIMAVADGSYRFIYFDVGAYGSEGDANVFKSSQFGKNVIEDIFHFPPNAQIAGKQLPYFFIADDAFPLCKRIIKPFSLKNLSDDEGIFNYRLSRARRCVENAFGILSAKWLCLRKTLFCGPDRAQKILTTCCFLHNYLLKDPSSKYTYCSANFADRIDTTTGNIIEGEWREKINQLQDSLYQSSLPSCVGRNTNIGKYVRNVLRDYVVSSDGSVPWQRRAVNLEYI